LLLTRAPARILIFRGHEAKAQTIDLTAKCANTPECQLPYDLVVDGSGNIFVSDIELNAIFVVTPDGNRHLLTGGGTGGLVDGPLVSAAFRRPAGLCLDREGNLLIADSANHCIRRIGKNGLVSTIAGTGTPGLEDGEPQKARFATPIDVCCDRTTGTIYVADAGNHCIRKVTQGSVSTLAGNGQPGKSDGWGVIAQLNTPISLDGNDTLGLLVADRENHRLVHIAPDGSVQTLCGGLRAGKRDGKGRRAAFTYPGNLAIAPDGFLWLVDFGNDLLRKVALPFPRVSLALPSTGPLPMIEAHETKSAAGEVGSKSGDRPVGTLSLLTGANPTWVPVGKSSVITAIVTDEQKRPVPEVTVTFTIIAGGGHFAIATPAEATVSLKTDAMGLAQIELLGVSLGINKVRVLAPSVEPQIVSITGGVE